MNELHNPNIDAIFAELAQPTQPEWRIKSTKGNVKPTNGKYPSGTKAGFVPYVDARWVAQRLDDVLGAQNWRSSVTNINPDGSVIVRLELRPDGMEWIWREDIGYPNNPESKLPDADPLKGAVSDGLKRAAVQFGIGRFLYALKIQWVEINEYGDPLRPITVGNVGKLNGQRIVVVQDNPGPPQGTDTPPATETPREMADVVNLGPPDTWTGTLAYHRNKIDDADTIQKIEQATNGVVQFNSKNVGGAPKALVDYLNVKREKMKLGGVSL